MIYRIGQEWEGGGGIHQIKSNSENLKMNFSS